MKQKLINVPIAQALMAVDVEAFLHAALVGLNARAGLTPLQRADCEGISVPGLAWSHPFNLGLFALQKELRELGWPPMQRAAAVFRYSALTGNALVLEPAVADFVDWSAQGQPVALTEFLIKAAAVSTLVLGKDQQPCFDATEVAGHAARFLTAKRSAVAADAQRH